MDVFAIFGFIFFGFAVFIPILLNLYGYFTGNPILTETDKRELVHFGHVVTCGLLLVLFFRNPKKVLLVTRDSDTQEIKTGLKKLSEM